MLLSLLLLAQGATAGQAEPPVTGLARYQFEHSFALRLMSELGQAADEDVVLKSVRMVGDKVELEGFAAAPMWRCPD